MLKRRFSNEIPQNTLTGVLLYMPLFFCPSSFEAEHHVPYQFVALQRKIARIQPASATGCYNTVQMFY
jgi:hypothetical protein